MSKHTPGPLTVRQSMVLDNTGGKDFAIVDSDGELIAETFEHVGAEDDGGKYIVRPAEANAVLFAAAPELLEALERIKRLALRKNKAIAESMEEVVKIARAAIAKARGG